MNTTSKMFKASLGGGLSLLLIFALTGQAAAQQVITTVVQHAPAIYQEINSVKQIIPGHYVLQGKGQVGFRVAAYDRSRPLVIDPVLIYSTFLGGSSFEEGFGIAVDAAGSAYITGLTNSADFPTVNAFQASFAGPTFPVAQCQDVAVSTDLGLCSSNASVDAGSSDPNGGGADRRE